MKLTSIYWPRLAREGVRSLRMHLNSKEPLVVSMPITVYVKDLFLRARRNHNGLTMTLEEAQHQLVLQEEVEGEEDQLSILQLQANRLESAELIVPLGIIDLKGKAPETPSSKPKKRKLVRASEVPIIININVLDTPTDKDRRLSLDEGAVEPVRCFERE